MTITDNEHIMRFDETGVVDFAVVLVMEEPGEGGKARVLAVSRRNVTDDYGIPGGGIEPGETPAEAASRELHEETGVRCHPWEMSFVFDRKSRRGGWTRVFVASFRMMAKKLTFTPGAVKGNLVQYDLKVEEMKRVDPEIDVAWKTPAEMVNYPSFGDFNRALFAFLHIDIGE